MKLIVTLCVVALVAAANAALDAQQIEMMKALVTECQAKEGASQADVDLLMSGKFPDSHEGHCIVACANEKLGVIKDGKFNKAGFIDMSKMVVNNDAALLAAAVEIADECEGAINGGSDRCDAAANFETCLHKGLKTRNLEVDLF